MTFENPHAIIEEILVGMKKNNHVVIEDRKEAIAHAIRIAQKDDVILLAGKGHETYQEIRGVNYPFDEREIVAQIVGEI